MVKVLQKISSRSGVIKHFLSREVYTHLSFFYDCATQIHYFEVYKFIWSLVYIVDFVSRKATQVCNIK